MTQFRCQSPNSSINRRTWELLWARGTRWKGAKWVISTGLMTLAKVSAAREGAGSCPQTGISMIKLKGNTHRILKKQNICFQGAVAKKPQIQTITTPTVLHSKITKYRYRINSHHSSPLGSPMPSSNQVPWDVHPFLVVRVSLFFRTTCSHNATSSTIGPVGQPPQTSQASLLPISVNQAGEVPLLQLTQAN